MVGPARGRAPQFLRRVHNRPAMRRRSSLVVFLQLLLVASGLAAGGLLAWGGYYWVHTNSIFRLRTLSMDAVPANLRPAARRELDTLQGANLLLVDLDVVQRRLERIPQVSRARVMRNLPSTIEVVLEPRPTWGILSGSDGDLEISAEGIVLGPASHDDRLPRIVVNRTLGGSIGADGRLDAGLRESGWLAEAVAAHDWLTGHGPLPLGPVDHYRLEPDGVVLVVDAENRWEVAIGDADDLEGKVENLNALLRQSPPHEPSHLDLRYRDMVVVKTLPPALVDSKE